MRVFAEELVVYKQIISEIITDDSKYPNFVNISLQD